MKLCIQINARLVHLKPYTNKSLNISYLTDLNFLFFRFLTQSQTFVKHQHKMSATLHSFFLAKMAGYTKEFKAKGGLVIWENGYLQLSAPSTEILDHYQSRAVSCLFEDSLQLSEGSWNNFVLQNSDGSSLFKQWLTHPFCSSPNVQIHPNDSTFELIFVGRRVAVQDAKQTMASEVCRVMPVDR